MCGPFYTEQIYCFRVIQMQTVRRYYFWRVIRDSIINAPLLSGIIRVILNNERVWPVNHAASPDMAGWTLLAVASKVTTPPRHSPLFRILACCCQRIIPRVFTSYPTGSGPICLAEAYSLQKYRFTCHQQSLFRQDCSVLNAAPLPHHGYTPHWKLGA